MGAAALFAVPGTAFADHADDLYKEGVTLFEAGNTQGAYDKLLAAWKERQSSDIAGNLAETELKLGKKADAAGHLAYALAHIPASFPEARRKPMQDALKDLSDALAVIHVTTSPAGADVFVNDKEIGRTPLADTVYVDPGKVTIRAELDGHLADPVAIDVGAGKTVDEAIVLQPIGGPIEHPATRTFVPAIVGYVVGAIGFGIGGGFLALHGSQTTDAENLGRGKLCPGPDPAVSCKTVADAQRKANTSGNVAIGGFIGGGVGVAAGTGLLIWALTGPKRAPKAGAITVVPLVGASAIGVIAGGGF